MKSIKENKFTIEEVKRELNIFLIYYNLNRRHGSSFKKRIKSKNSIQCGSELVSSET